MQGRDVEFKFQMKGTLYILTNTQRNQTTPRPRPPLKMWQLRMTKDN